MEIVFYFGNKNIAYIQSLIEGTDISNMILLK